MFEPRICSQERSRNIYNEGYCGEVKTYELPARTIKMYGSTLNLVKGCNRCRAKLLKEIVRAQRKTHLPQRTSQFPIITTPIGQVRIGSHREWVETTPKHGFHRIVEEYTTHYNDCLPGKVWLKEHEHDKYPEPTIALSANGKALSVNGDFRKGAIKEFIKTNKALPYPVINERREEKMSQKPNNQKRRQILDFARDNNLVIHPGGGFEYYIKLFYKSGHCPCDKDRPDCPCPESVEEVKTNGHCKCCLFWRDLDTYKESHVRKY